MSNPLPSELRENIYSLFTDLRVDIVREKPGDVYMHYANELEQLFEQEYLHRCDAAKPEKVEPGLIWGERVANGYNRAIDQYEHNLKQLSEGDNHARSK